MSKKKDKDIKDSIVETEKAEGNKVDFSKMKRKSNMDRYKSRPQDLGDDEVSIQMGRQIYLYRFNQYFKVGGKVEIFADEEAGVIGIKPVTIKEGYNSYYHYIHDNLSRPYIRCKTLIKEMGLVGKRYKAHWDKDAEMLIINRNDVVR